MNRARNQLFTSSCFAVDQYAGIRWRDLVHFPQKTKQGRTAANDFFEVVYVANLFLEVNILLLESALQRFDLFVRFHVGDSDRDLVGYLAQQLGIGLRVTISRLAPKREGADTLWSET